MEWLQNSVREHIVLCVTRNYVMWIVDNYTITLCLSNEAGLHFTLCTKSYLYLLLVPPFLPDVGNPFNIVLTPCDTAGAGDHLNIPSVYGWFFPE